MFHKTAGMLLALMFLTAAIPTLPAAGVYAQSSGTAPYSIYATPSSLQANAGASAMTELFVFMNSNVPQNATRPQVTLTASCPSQIACSLNVTQGVPPFNSWLQASVSAGTAAGVYNLEVSGTSVNGTATASIPLTVGTPSVTVTLNPTSGSVKPGQGLNATVSVSGTQQPTSLRVNGCPSGATCTLGSTSGTIPFTTTLEITTVQSIQAGSYPIFVIAFGPGGSAGTLFTLHVVPTAQFTMTMSPSSGTAVQGGTATAAVSVSPVAGVNSGTVSLSVAGCPTGAMCTVSPQSGSAPFTSSLVVSASQSAAVGSYILSVFGNNGAYQTAANYTLSVVKSTGGQSISVSMAPPSLSLFVGEQATVAVFASLIPPGPASGIVYSAQCPGLTCTVSPSQSGAAGNATLVIQSNRNTTAGIYTVTVSATLGTLKGSGTMTVTAVSSPGQMPVKFVEHGLSSGATWRVAIGSEQNSTTGSSMSFSLFEGAYNYTVSAQGYTAVPGSGVLVVSGAQTVTITFFAPLSISLNTTAVTANPGGSATILATVQYGGSFSDVTVTASGQGGITGTASPSGNGTFSIALSVPGGAAPGAYFAVVRAHADGAEAAAAVVVGVPSASGSVPPGQIGSSVLVASAVNATNDIEGNITAGIASGLIVASINVTPQGGSIEALNPGITAAFSYIGSGQFGISINGSGIAGSGAVLFTVPRGMFTLSSSQTLAVYLDGSQLPEAASLGSVLTSSATQGSFIVIATSTGYQVLVLVPHFSSHTISMAEANVQQGTGTTPNTGPSSSTGIGGAALQYIEIGAAVAAVAIAAVAAFVVLRKRRKYKYRY